jgi:hypothetical protein
VQQCNDDANALMLIFVAEENGFAARQLKQRLSEGVLSQERTVKRAYLSHVRYVQGGRSSVALCLVGEGADETAIAGAIGQVFASEFALDQHMDIMFLTPAWEKDITRVCKPFFSR